MSAAEDKHDFGGRQEESSWVRRQEALFANIEHWSVQERSWKGRQQQDGGEKNDLGRGGQTEEFLCG